MRLAQMLSCFLLLKIASIAAISESNVNELCKQRLFSTISGLWVSESIQANSSSNSTNSTKSIDPTECALQSPDAEEAIIWFGSADGLEPDLRWNYDTFTLSLELELHGDSGNAGLLFQAKSITSTTHYGGQYYYIALHPDDNLVIIGRANTSWSLIHGVSYVIEPNTKYTITVKANVPSYDIYIDNDLIFNDISLDGYQDGTIGLKTYGVSATFLSLEFEPFDGDEDVTCGNSAFLSAGYAIGDSGNLFDDIKDICESDEFRILVTALSVIPKIGKVAQAAGNVCKGVSFVGVICDIFDIDECSPVEPSASIVASCWSSNTFSPQGISLHYAFQNYLDDEYGISSKLGDSKAVKNELYRLTEITLDNCGRTGNYFIAGIYDVNNNAEQNDIVSDVTEFLVNEGIANTENPVGGVSSVDRSEASGIPLTDVIRSNAGVVFHYDKPEGLSNDDEVGIFYCEFNVIEGNWDGTDRAESLNGFMHPIIVLIFIFIFI